MTLKYKLSAFPCIHAPSDIAHAVFVKNMFFSNAGNQGREISTSTRRYTRLVHQHLLRGLGSNARSGPTRFTCLVLCHPLQCNAEPASLC